MTILIVKLNAIGDVLFATPLLEACRQVWPEAAVDWLLGRHSEPILRDHPSLRRRIVYDGPWGGSGLSSLIAYRRIMLHLRAQNYDLVFCLHRNFAAQLLCWGTRAPQRVGFQLGLSHRTMTCEVAFDDRVHETERYLNLLRALGPEVRNPGMRIGLTAEAQVSAELLLQELELPRPLVAVAPGGGKNPGTTMTMKRWPLERFVELTQALRATLGVGVVVVGSPDEADLCAAVRAASPGVANLCGRTVLPHLAAVLARCAAVVANDTGPLHIAAALGVPTVALFGPTDPRLVAPLGPRHRYLWEPPECGPCYRPDNVQSRRQWSCDRAGDELRCLRNVAVGSVCRAVQEALARRAWPEHSPFGRRSEG
ncbi:MAG: lipopolysaccharide heptosyltransferase II [Fimbriimonadaceae bacterium]|nr:lipopolysaccharide heptosyltransferase II [Fimbriimonadaceae bacterium]